MLFLFPQINAGLPCFREEEVFPSFASKVEYEISLLQSLRDPTSYTNLNSL